MGGRTFEQERVPLFRFQPFWAEKVVFQKKKVPLKSIWIHIHTSLYHAIRFFSGDDAMVH
jgi:hypothetical protein